MIKELEYEGFDVEYDDIYVIAGLQMRIQDIINHINSAFSHRKERERLLTIANSYYPKLFSLDLTLEDGINLINDAGGMSILAHSFYSYKDYDIITNTQKDVFYLLNYLCQLGIQGLEVFYPQFSQMQTKWLLQEARNRNLEITAGSDFHGTVLRKAMMNLEIPETVGTIKKLLEINRY